MSIAEQATAAVAKQRAASAAIASAAVAPAPEEALIELNPIEQFFETAVQGWNVDLLSYFSKRNTTADGVPPAEPPPPFSPPETVTFSYTGDETAPVGARVAPSLSASKTGQVVRPGESIRAVRVVVKDGLPFAVLPSGLGYVCLLHPRTGAHLITKGGADPAANAAVSAATLASSAARAAVSTTPSSGLEVMAASALVSAGSAVAGVVAAAGARQGQGLLEGVDVKEVTRGCFAVAAEVESSKQGRESTLTQLSFLQTEAEVRVRDLEAAMGEQSALWGACLDGTGHRATPRLVTHVTKAQALARRELQTAVNLRHGIRSAVDLANGSPTSPPGNNAAATWQPHVTTREQRSGNGGGGDNGVVDDAAAASVNSLVAAASAVAAEDAAAQATLVAEQAATREALVEAAAAGAAAQEVAQKVAEARRALEAFALSQSASAEPWSQSSLKLELTRAVEAMKQGEAGAVALAASASEKRAMLLGKGVAQPPNEIANATTGTTPNGGDGGAQIIKTIGGTNSHNKKTLEPDVLSTSQSPLSLASAELMGDIGDNDSNSGGGTRSTTSEKSAALNSTSEAAAMGRKTRRKHVEEALTKSAVAGTNALYYKSDSDAEGGF
eukprot:CAMPEP_0171813222 /NCGR_PEP_ID=MMETSP0991-20121206/79097_1 /TAXON_ID=483369 /ORGANISM="non described non described, Strain CCMP2098" /LENGTH=613 /DNA_ID=CAMNT_0012426783 /DNA_START=113 /DNA_END=1952 /DNA_ORIENTATION=+